MNALKVWLKGFSLSMASEMAYRMSFILIVISIIFKDMIGPLVSLIIYSISSGIPGWTLMEFILFQGIVIFVFGVWHAFIGGISWGTSELVVEGELERVLIRPSNPLVYIASNYIDFHGIAEVVVGFIIIIFALMHLSFNFSLLIPFILLIALALIFILSISIMMAAMAIIFVNIEAMESIIWALLSITSYPITIYKQGIKFFFTFIIPAAIASYWPAAILLGKEAVSRIYMAIIPVMIFFALSLWLWKFALKKYQSAGG
jgi:ABC-2 type transport system permease protein